MIADFISFYSWMICCPPGGRSVDDDTSAPLNPNGTASPRADYGSIYKDSLREQCQVLVPGA